MKKIVNEPSVAPTEAGFVQESRLVRQTDKSMPTDKLAAIVEVSDGMTSGFQVAEELVKPAQHKPAMKQLLRGNRIFAEGSDEEAKVAISAYKNLRTRVMLRLDQIGTNSVMVAGATQNVGKTLTSINLALAFARRFHKKVVLVDMDLRSPTLHHLFGFEPTANIIDVAEGRVRLSRALVDPKIKNLRILPGTRRMEDSSEAIVSDSMLALLNEFEQQKNTLFVYDTPPILGCDDVSAVSPFMKACLFVIKERTTSRKELAAALQLFSGKCELLGVTINGSRESKFSSYYY